jgi:hypothetical protein
MIFMRFNPWIYYGKTREDVSHSVFAGSPLPDGRVDLDTLVSRYGISGFDVALCPVVVGESRPVICIFRYEAWEGERGCRFLQRV